MSIKKATIALGLGFCLVASSGAEEYDNTARDTEPFSCRTDGRIYAPRSASIVIDAQSGEILSGDRIDEQRYPASMTKMMTAALIFDALRNGRLRLDDKITVTLSKDTLNTRGNSRSTWLHPGEQITVEEAILAITVASANNVSVLMAEKLAGSESGFVAFMNKKAREIGMTRTVFKNSTGLPDKGQRSTARDMAKLALHLYRKYPEYYHFFSAPKAEFGSWRGGRAKYNHNRLAVENKQIDGLKTGFICDSGYNLAASAVNGPYRTISIVFGGRTPYSRNEVAATLLQEGLATLRSRAGRNEVADKGRNGYVHDNEQMNMAELKGNMLMPPSKEKYQP